MFVVVRIYIVNFDNF